MTLDASGSGYSITEYTSNNTVVGHIGVDSRLIYVVTCSLSSYDFYMVKIYEVYIRTDI